ncbi:MAG: hypothetical protein LQ352_008144, partial [Teloschistes flavicans]
MSQRSTGRRTAGVESDTRDVLALAIRRSARIQQRLANEETENDLEDEAIASPVPAAAAPHVERPDGPLHFFALPPEIRNMIYRYVVRFPKGVVKAKTMSPRLRIFLASRRFFHEASGLFYKENSFIFASCYVHKGDDPFGPRLDRIERCLLHLSSTQSHCNDFLWWYNRNFVDAVSPNHNLRFLIIRSTLEQLETCNPLLALSGINYVQVDVGLPRVFSGHLQFHPNLMRNTMMGCYLDIWEGRGDGIKGMPQQLLERLLMYQHKVRPEEETQRIFEACKEHYVYKPRLRVGLGAERLRAAKKRGGWRGNHELYEFLGITKDRYIRIGALGES